MAGIDKTYVNREQWDQAMDFLKETHTRQIAELGNSIEPYYDGKYPDGQSEVVLWNTSTIQDIWLKRNCQLDFVQDRLKVQYGTDTKLEWWAEKCMFDVPGLYFIEIKTDKDCLYFFDTDLGSDTISIYDETDDILVYGTTRILELIDSAIERLAWDTGNFGGEMTLLYYGCELKFKDGSWTSGDEQIHPWPIRRTEPLLPRIRINPPLSDIQKSQNIYISNDEIGIHPITDYKNYPCDPEIIGQWIKIRLPVPSHINRFIY